MTNQYVVFTDGACSGNPGPGGAGIVIVDLQTKCHREISFYDPETTNNQMEITAVLNTLRYFDKNNPKAKLRIFTDSQYVQKGLTEWCSGWVRRGWRKADGKPVLNKELWKELYYLYTKLKPEIIWVKGHACNEGNNMADKLATEAITRKAGVGSFDNI